MAGPLTGALTIPRTDLNASFEQTSRDDNFIADQIFAPFQVPDVSGALMVTPLAALKEDRGDDVRQADGGYQRTQWTADQDSYATTERGGEEAVDQHKAKIYRSYLDFEKFTAVRLRAMALRRKEIRVKDLCHDTTNFTGATGTLAITNEWDDSTNAIPINDVQTGMKAIRDKCGLSLFHLQISWNSWLDLSLCSQIREVLKYTEKPEGFMPLNALAQALGVAKVVVGDAKTNTANLGLTASLGDVWSDEYAFLYVPCGADVVSPGIGRTFFYNEEGGSEMIYAEEYLEPRVRSKVLRVRYQDQQKRWSTRYGFLFSNVATN